MKTAHFILFILDIEAEFEQRAPSSGYRGCMQLYCLNMGLFALFQECDFQGCQTASSWVTSSPWLPSPIAVLSGFPPVPVLGLRWSF